ncbi:MAG: DUF3291 domain-containing protein [Caulobacteraceae bacterium]|nr:DUF3291 domain-containing protein [Caulobacteraceae bacterium]
MSAAFHLAQVNIARLVAPMDDPRIAGFREALDRINALGEAQPGFVWRATGPGFDALDVPGFDDPLILTNASVWEGVEHLAAFAYRTEHRLFVRRAREWFEPPTGPQVALWWVYAGHRPDLAECAARLAALRAQGPTPEAFDFKTRFPPPMAQAS